MLRKSRNDRQGNTRWKTTEDNILQDLKHFQDFLYRNFNK